MIQSMFLSTPVVFIVYNRPDLTARVFRAIARAKPAKLLIIADGPRSPEEAERCEKVRGVIEKVDWDCEILRDYSDDNLGCGRRVSTGLDWVFSEVEEAIILEDDCLPAQSFFPFCQTLLERYRHDKRIMHISGDNFQLGRSRTDYSYYFSKYSHNWGWATWRRAWQYYDYDMKTWSEFKETNAIGAICEDAYEHKYFTALFDRISLNAQDIWGYQWLYACWSQNGLSILPNSNLVSNIGFRSDGTHTNVMIPQAGLPTKEIWKVRHPPFVVRHAKADIFTFDNVFGGKRMRKSNTWRAKINRYLLLLSRRIKLCR